MNIRVDSKPRCAVFTGPYLSGKTTLLEAVLSASGATKRKGAIKNGNTVGDSSPEARARTMSTELNIATTSYLGDTWTFVDCPGSIELAQDSRDALMIADIAVIVCEADAGKAIALSPMLKFLDDHAIPHAIFINKMDVATTGIRETVEALQNVSKHPLVLREIPIRDADTTVGMVDLVSERAFRWKQDGHSQLIQLPDTLKDREELERTQMLESLADFDDGLMEKLLEDVTPSTEEVYQNLTKDLQDDKIVPVFFGSAEGGHGVTRLLKLLRHEGPEPEKTAKRLGIEENGPAALVFKTQHGSQTGKLSFARILGGELSDGMTLGDQRISGIYKMMGARQDKISKAGLGDLAGLGRMDAVETGDLLTEEGKGAIPGRPAPLTPLISLAVHAENRNDEVKLSSALQKLAEEDPSLTFGPDPQTGEFLLSGQGEIHLLIAIDRMKNRYKLGLRSQSAQIPYKETIRKPVRKHARHKKQSGGHGEFGDVHMEIKPLPRGSGFIFSDTITGGAVPKNYIPAVENGVKEYLVRGPLGFTVVDISVNLYDGQHHTVDSSEMAFKKAAQLCMREAMPECGPVLLEPIMAVLISVPNEFTPKVQRLVSGRRGQILGFDAKSGWRNWDEVNAQMPQAEMHDLIIELRSMTMGVGSYTAEFDHLRELSGRIADDLIMAHKAEN